MNLAVFDRSARLNLGRTGSEGAANVAGPGCAGARLNLGRTGSETGDVPSMTSFMPTRLPPRGPYNPQADKLDTPVEILVWDGGWWTHVADATGNGSVLPENVAAGFMDFVGDVFVFAVLRPPAEGSRGTFGNTVIRAERNAQPPARVSYRRMPWEAYYTNGEHMGQIMVTTRYTFYAKTFAPGEQVRFDFPGGSMVGAGAR